MNVDNVDSEVPQDINTQDDLQESPPKQHIAVVEILSKEAIKRKMAEMVQGSDLQNANEGLVIDPEHKSLPVRKKKHPHKRSISSIDRKTLRTNGGAWWLKGKK